jgi:hypothetical protein
MPKITKHPRLRSLKRTAKSGKVTVYYAYDMRPEGKKDIPLGKDWATALAKWDELHNKKPRIKGTIEEAFALFEEQKLPEYKGETRQQYIKGLRWLRPVFGSSTWAAVKLPHLVKFLRMRKGKTQANRNMDAFQVIWNFARLQGLTEIAWPAAGMERSGWKNPEKPRKVRVSDEVFAAIYAEGDQLLRDAMDLASATGMRVTDVRTVPLPHGDVLHLDAHKTGAESDFDLALSTVLPDLIKRRRANKNAEHLMLLAGPFKKPVTYWMLSERFTNARARAAKKAREAGDEQMALAVEAMILRDCRKMASNLAGTLEEASQLLQHTNTATTRRHYRSKVDTLKPVR